MLVMEQLELRLWTSLVYDRLAAFHNPSHFIYRYSDIRSRIAFHGNQIGKVPRRDGTKLVLFSK
jgi:hypothetical protein